MMVVPFNEVAVSVKELLQRDPEYGLFGGAAPAAVRVPGQNAALSIADESNAFTYIEAPESWWAFQAGSMLGSCPLIGSPVDGPPPHGSGRCTGGWLWDRRTRASS